MADFTDGEKRAALRDELRMRRYVYPKRVAEGKMTEEQAKRGIDIIIALIDDYAEPSLFNNRT